jgi:hypothetical protein
VVGGLLDGAWPPMPDLDARSGRRRCPVALLGFLAITLTVPLLPREGGNAPYTEDLT